MTNKPSQWAMDVWREAVQSVDPLTAREWRKRTPAPLVDAPALVIENARKQWEAEICEWLLGQSSHRSADPVYGLQDEALIDGLVSAIGTGEYRKDKP